MGRLHIFCVFVGLSSVLGLTLSCRVNPNMFKRLTMSQLLEAADIVAHGTLDRLEGSEGIYTIFCILKNKNPDIPVPEEVTLNVLGRSSAACTKRPIDISGGTEVLMMLKRQDDGSFGWHDIVEEIPPTTVTFNATEENLEKATNLPGFQSPVTPDGRDPSKEPKCPETIKMTTTKPVEDDPDNNSSVNLIPVVWGVFLVTLSINAVNLFTWFLSL